MLNFFETVVWNMRGYDEGKIKVHADFYKVWEFLTADKLKSNQFAGDGGSIVSNIIELESKTKFLFDYENVKTKKGNENTIVNKGLIMVQFDQKAK